MWSHLKNSGHQIYKFIVLTDAEAEAPILWPPDVNRWHWKRPWCWERLKAEGEEGNRGWDGWMVSPIQWTWTWANLGDGKGQGGLACCSPRGHKESDMTEQLNWTEDSRFHGRLLRPWNDVHWEILPRTLDDLPSFTWPREKYLGYRTASCEK